MHRDSGEWTVDRWGPTAPESCVLLDGAKGSGAEAFRLAVLESIARRKLAVAGETDLPDGETPTGLLHPGTETRPVGARPLDAIQEVFDEARTRTFRGSGVRVKELSRAARRRYGSLDGYVKAEVLPALERRGLYERRKRKLLWLFPVTRWELTRSGEAARTQLKHNRKLGEEHFGEWVRRDSEQAYRFLGLAGSSLLLMEALHPELRDLQDVEDDDYGGGIAYPLGAPGSSGEIDPNALPDLEGALVALDSWSDGVWGDSGGSTDGSCSTGGGGFDGGGGGGFDGGGGGGFDGGGGGGGF